jgi:hypothetical protein
MAAVDTTTRRVRAAPGDFRSVLIEFVTAFESSLGLHLLFERGGSRVALGGVFFLFLYSLGRKDGVDAAQMIDANLRHQYYFFHWGFGRLRAGR